MGGENINCHIVAVPYPGRGHINPMLNLCRQLLLISPQITVSFVVTEEWLGLLSDSPPPSPNLSFATIPNVMPSEIGRGKDFAGFFRASQTEMEAPVQRLLDRLPKPCSLIIYDTYLGWVVALGSRRNVPVASLFTMSATVFSISYHSHLIREDLSSDIIADGGKVINNIPGVAPLRMRDLPTPLYGEGHEVFPQALAAIHSAALNAQYLLFPSVYELEPQVVDALKQLLLPLKIYTLGLSIPHLNLQNPDMKPHYYLQWLDAQPHASVLYISQGSFLSVSEAQLQEIIAGVHASGVRFLWVARGEAEQCGGGGKGLVVPWCDQLKVLCHPSVGGFWSHCGWNSTKEGAFAGLPMLTFPIFWDQTMNSKMIVDDWKVGVRVKKDEEEGLVKRDEICRVVLSVMDLASEEGMERRRRAKEIQQICRNANCEGGSSHVDLIAFIRDVISG